MSVYVGSSQVQIGGTYRFRGGQGLISPSNVSSGNFSALGNFSFGSTLFVDKTNDRVGIGTTTPNQKLVVAGTINATAGVNVTGGLRVSELASCDTIDTDGS